MDNCECRNWARVDISADQFFSDHHPKCPKAKWIKVFKVSPGKGLNSCCEKDIKNVIIWLEEAEPGDVIEIKISRMQESDYDRLPEYAGP